MSHSNIPKLQIGNLESVLPIIQGGMGVGVSLSRLSSAVANEGGIGVIATAGIGAFEADFEIHFKETYERGLRNEVKKARAKTKGIIGTNILMALSNWDTLALIAIDEGSDLVFLGAGLPLKHLSVLPGDKLMEVIAKIVPIVSSARTTNLIFRYWAKHFNYVPNAVVVEGPLAGGHLGFKKEQIDDPDYKLEKILPEVISVTTPYEKQFNKKISVIAAGGIYTGADIYKFMKMGASGVQMATRFVATHECDASIEFKEAYINCAKDDITIIDSPVGLPGRAIRNKFLNEVSEGIRHPFNCPWKCLSTCDYKKAPYCIAIALRNAKKGNLKEGFAFAGANAYRIDKIISVKELISTLLEEYDKASVS
jgi:nitronate monooxygenase